MIQGGDPTGTGKGGTSIWGKKFNDEIRESLKVNLCFLIDVPMVPILLIGILWQVQEFGIFGQHVYVR